jgi:hypothetical protein
MKNKNIETDFVKFIIDKYSPNPGAAASKNDSGKDSDDEDENEKINEASAVISVHKIQMLNDRIRANGKKLSVEKDSKRRQILNLQIWIDQYQIRMTQLKS